MCPGFVKGSYSTRSDKYDRYLADVFIPAAAADGAGGAYLNNLLIEKGHAVRV